MVDDSDIGKKEREINVTIKDISFLFMSTEQTTTELSSIEMY